MKVRAAFFAFVILLTTLSASAGTDQKLAVRISPAVAFAPATLVVRTTIQSDAENRTVQIVAESNDFYRSSEVQLDGEHAPRVSVFEFRSLPSGTYLVTATLRDSKGQSRASVRSEVNVMQSGGVGNN
jgi:hypothetical protein